MRLQGDLLNLTQFISKFLSISQAEACFFTSTYKKDRSLINYKTHGWLYQPRPQAFFLFLPLRSSTGKALGTRMLCHLFFLLLRLLLKCGGSKQSRVRTTPPQCSRTTRSPRPLKERIKQSMALGFT